jgi:hypothetical protein
MIKRISLALLASAILIAPGFAASSASQPPLQSNAQVVAATTKAKPATRTFGKAKSIKRKYSATGPKARVTSANDAA